MKVYPYICVAHPSGKQFPNTVVCANEKEFHGKLDDWNRLGAVKSNVPEVAGLSWSYFVDHTRPVIEYEGD